MNIWLGFVFCAGVILYAGTQLSTQGEAIAARTGLGRSWIGLVLLATVTSLPELISGVSAVTLHDLPNLAVSGTLGSCMLNMVVIASLDLASKNRPVSQLVHEGHILSAGFCIVLIGFAAIDILFGKYLPILTALNSIDPISLVYIVVYLMAMKLIYAFEKKRRHEFVEEVAQAEEAKGQSLKRSIFIFVINSIVIVVAACYLPEIASQISKMTGWGESFVGSSFVAVTTCLPEIAVSFAAARMANFDMAVANLLGSNLFNICILAIVDLCYLKGPLLRSVSQVNALTALTTMIAMGIVVIGLTYRSEKKFLFVAGDAIAIFFVCLMANVLLFVVH
ncbi:MAG: sodium:calcium antiporter [Cyanobacteria bacterium REEB67]|nr:sodium:calcium antiporter [Cyanobacteria bacterium REEB67]